MPYPKLKETVLNAIREHFNSVLGRPEILNRFGDNFVVFDFIRPSLDEEIVDLLLSKLIAVTREHKKIELIIDPPVREMVIKLSKTHLHHGGRGIRNAIDSSLVNPLNRVLFDLGIEAGSKVRLIKLLDNGEDAPNRFELEKS
jgi:ATP-dependent Clp protease ATP-binding subunit ClpA